MALLFYLNYLFQALLMGLNKFLFQIILIYGLFKQLLKIAIMKVKKEKNSNK